MVTVISRFRVRNGMEETVRQAFLRRPRLVDNIHGFQGLEVLTDASDPAVFYLVTRWRSEQDFRAWHGSEAHHASHEFIPKGLKLDPGFTQAIIGERIDDPESAHLSDALEGRTAPLAQWLADSDAVFALLLGGDGTIRWRNRAAERVFPPRPEESGNLIWSYLVDSCAEHLRPFLADRHGTRFHFPLNLADGLSDPVSAEGTLIPCDGAFLLVGAPEQSFTGRLHEEMLEVTNQFSVDARELSRKNRELQAVNREMQRLSRTDMLTGLANRRAFFEALEQELSRAERTGAPVTVVLADLDRFKSINDRYGHPLGDRVLERTGALLRDCMRKHDLAARYGGEEFAVLLGATNLAEGITAAQRIQEKLRKVEIPGVPRRVTLSAGVAMLRLGETANTLLARADAALYHAKHSGRDRVMAEAPADGGEELEP